LKDAREERKNLRPFGQKVTCYDYEVTDKLSPRSYEARMIGYTSSFGTYWVRTQEGATKLAKNPIPIPESESESESESGDELPEMENIKIQSRPISPEFQPDLPSRPPTPETPSTPETPAKAPKKKRIHKDDD